MVSGLREEFDRYWSDRVPGLIEYTRYVLNNDTDFNHTLRLLIKNIPPGAKVIDMGAGVGLVALEMARMGYDTTAVDCNPDVIEAAKKLADEMELDIDFRIDDIVDPDLPARSFDVVIARNSVWNLEDPMKAYAQWKNLLRPNG